MDTKQFEYIISIADEKNLLRASQKHNVTSSALSQHLSKIEKELGTSLFIRGKSEWTLTEAGKIYLEAARQIVNIKERAYASISDLAGIHNNRLSIGLTPVRGTEMFIHVFPKFHEMFPDIMLEPREMSVAHMQESIRQGNLDLGFMTLSDHQKTNDIYEYLVSEKMLLCVPENYPGLQNSADTADFPVEKLKYESFVLIYKRSTGRWIVDRILERAGFFPHILFETANYQTILATIQAGLGVGFLPEYYAQKKPEGVRFYSVKDAPEGSVSVSYSKNTKLTTAERYLIQLAKNYYTDIFSQTISNP